MLGLQSWTEAKWSQVRQAVQPPRDLFSIDAPAPQMPTVAISSPVSEQETPRSSFWHSYAKPSVTKGLRIHRP